MVDIVSEKYDSLFVGICRKNISESGQDFVLITRIDVDISD